MGRHIYKGPGLKILFVITAVAVLAGFVTSFVSGSDLTARSTMRIVKLGVIVSSIVAWLIYSAIEKSRTPRPRRRPSRVPREPRGAPVRRLSANPAPKAAPDLPDAPARPRVPEPPLDSSRWMGFAAALDLEFREEALVGRMEDHPVRIAPRPRGAEAILTLAAPVGVPLSASVNRDGEVQANSDDGELRSRFLAGATPTWMIALGEPMLRIEEDRLTVSIDEVTVDLDLLRGMLLCAAAGARSVIGGGA